jgi:hypothetical protein
VINQATIYRSMFVRAGAAFAVAWPRIGAGATRRGLVAVVAAALAVAGLGPTTSMASAATPRALPAAAGIHQKSPFLEAVSHRRWNRMYRHGFYGHRGYPRPIILPYPSYAPYQGGAYMYRYDPYIYGSPYSYGYGSRHPYGFGNQYRYGFDQGPRESGTSKRGR